MRKTFGYPAALLFLSVLIVSCKKEQFGNSIIPAQPDQYINVSVASGDTYTFVADAKGTLSVSKQALHSQVSEILSEEGSIHYNYKPAIGYIGSDEVTLMYLSNAAEPGINTNSSSGCPGSHNNTPGTIVINLTVTK